MGAPQAMASVASVAQAAPLDHATILRIILGILLAMLLAALDQTIVATALPTIGAALGHADQLPWVVTSYLLSSTAVTPLYGKLSDIHGRRVVLLTAITIFVVGSLACALAPSMLALIVARFVQGLGGGGLISLAHTIIADLVAPRERARYQGYIAGVFVTSSVAGPVLGGVFAAHLHWSLIFWINLPLGLAAYLMTSSALRRLPRRERPQRLDLAGAAIMMAATTLLLLGLSWGGKAYAWTSLPIVLLLTGSALCWGAFAWRIATARDPFLPLGVMLHPIVATGTSCACFVMGAFIGLSIYAPVYFETVRGLTPDQSGLALIPLMVGVVTGAIIGGRLMGHLKHYKRPPLIGLVIAILATSALAWGSRTLPMPVLEVLFAMAGLGLGTVLPVTTVAIQNAVSPHEVGTATGAMNFLRALGGAIAVAAFGAILLGGGADPGSAGASAAAAAHSSGLGAPFAGFAERFPLVLAAATIAFALGLACLLAMEEKKLAERPKGREEGSAAPAAGSAALSDVGG